MEDGDRSASSPWVGSAAGTGGRRGWRSGRAGSGKQPWVREDLGKRMYSLSQILFFVVCFKE